MSDRKLAGQFFDAAIGLLQRVRDEDAGDIEAAGDPDRRHRRKRR